MEHLDQWHVALHRASDLLIGSVWGPLVDEAYLSATACQRRAEECLAMADRMTDPAQKAAMLRFAEWWMRLGHILDAISPEVDELNRSA